MMYFNGEYLPQLHPDAAMNKDILIGALCTKLDAARIALERVLDMNVVTPAGLAMKANARWALKETDPASLAEAHNNHG